MLLPILAYFVLLIAHGNHGRSTLWGIAALQAAVVWGVCATLLIEALSFFEAVTRVGLSISWFLLIAVGAAWLFFQRSKGVPIKLPQPFRLEKGFNRFLLFSIAVILVLTFLLAVVAPPNTWDSLNYHMSRVAHWAQYKAIRPYATGIETQNSMPPGAEMLVLHFYVMGSGDQWVNLLEWGAMFICLAGTASMISLLGGSKTHQLFGALVVATLPSGILQATSTMTDYVVALWALSAAAEGLTLKLNMNAPTRPLLIASAAAGLALLTKPTAAAYLLPIGLFIGWVLRSKMRWTRVLVWGVIALAVVLLLNGGHFYRNQTLYGNPISPSNRLDQHVNQVVNWKVVTSNVLRNASLHLGTPSSHVNRAFALSVITLHEWIGQDVNDPRTTSEGSYKIRTPSAHETQAGNLIQFILILITLVLLFLHRGEIPLLVWGYLLTVIGTFFLFSILFQWQIFAGRYHLPFFVLFGPVIGFSLRFWRVEWTLQTAAGLMMLWSLPWLLGNNSRPLISGLPGNDIQSVLTEPRATVLFANGLYLQDPYTQITRSIHAQKCDAVGIALHGNSAEYPIWYLLGAPKADLQIEWMVAGTPSEVFRDPGFRPCAVICEKCPQDQVNFGALPVENIFGSFTLFLGGEG